MATPITTSKFLHEAVMNAGSYFFLSSSTERISLVAVSVFIGFVFTGGMCATFPIIYCVQMTSTVSMTTFLVQLFLFGLVEDLKRKKLASEAEFTARLNRPL